MIVVMMRRMINMSINFYDMQDRFAENDEEPMGGISYNGVEFQVVCVPAKNDNEEIVIQKVTEYYSLKGGTYHNPLVIVSCGDCNLKLMATDWVVTLGGLMTETYYVSAENEDDASKEAMDRFVDEHPNCDYPEIDDIYEHQ